MKIRKADRFVVVGMIVTIVLATLNGSIFLFREGKRMQADPIYAYSIKSRFDRDSARYNLRWACRLIIGEP